MKPFTGSYTLDDVQFLLTPLTIPDTPIAAKETLIQSGKQHYSQLLSHELLPTAEYIDLFHRAMAMNQQRVAKHIINLAQQINNARANELTLVSLARAGTPIGVLLKQVLHCYFQRDVAHYSISILRDVGVDANALRYIVKRHAPASLIFIDGWTAKGVIARQLATSLHDFATTDRVRIAPELAVLTDLCGAANFSASSDDYLIPSSLLNATVSGLISRTVYNDTLMQADAFHGCVYYQQFAAQDLSRYFIDTLLAVIAELKQTAYSNDMSNGDNRQQQQNIALAFIAWLSEHYHISHSHYIKLGIGEATRVLLRREARCLLLRDANAEATAHLRWLANNKAVPIRLIPDSPYQAVALIQEITL